MAFRGITVRSAGDEFPFSVLDEIGYGNRVRLPALVGWNMVDHHFQVSGRFSGSGAFGDYQTRGDFISSGRRSGYNIQRR